MLNTMYRWIKVAVAISVTLLAANVNASQVSFPVDQHGTPLQRNCVAMDVLDRQLAEDPQLAVRMADIEAQTQAYVHEHSGKAHTMATSTRTIPVYVHVIYNSAKPAENISDAQINSQLAVLNKDYGATNSDINNVPTEFSGVTSRNTGVQFILAGITRKASTKLEWGTADAMKKSSMGGVDPITPSTHMNMWVCNIGGGILGYAQFPGGAAATDGVVASPQYFGSSDYGSGYYAAPYDKGRTMTHEVGHYLNLRHIWGDGRCTATDYVDDTPAAGGANYGCPAYPTNTCANYAGNDMTMNYMDYTDDPCMYMFSVGQETRMWACLTSSRSTLGTTGGGGTGNLSPTANANGPYSATTGTAIAFSSAGSSDPDGSIASYNWTFGDGTTSTSANPSKTYTTAGTYTVTLTVTDNAGATGSSSATATITTSGGGGSSYITAESEANGGATTADGPVGNGVNVSAAIGSSTDVDWFSFDLNTTGTVNISVSWSATADLDWYLYHSSNTNANKYVARGYTSSNPEAANYTATKTGKYYIKVQRYSGTAPINYTLRVTGSTMAREMAGGDANPDGLKSVVVEHAYPNPFAQFTTISYQLPTNGSVSLKVYNAIGQLVKTLVSAEQSAGEHSIRWDGSNDSGAAVTNGTYFYQLYVNGEAQTRRMQLAR